MMGKLNIYILFKKRKLMIIIMSESINIGICNTIHNVNDVLTLITVMIMLF